MSAHSKYSPSKTEQFGNCAGSLVLCDALPDYMRNIAGPAALLGTCVHGLIEQALTKGNEPADYAGRIIAILNQDEENEKVSVLRPSARAPKNTTWFEIDDEIIDSATTMTDYVRRRCEEFGLDPMDRESLELESRTNPLPERDDTSGTADVTLKDWPRLLELIDYKNGGLFVGHKNNKQVMSYLLGKAIDSGWAFAKYMLTIVQPNADTDEGVIRSFEATEKELRAYQTELRILIAKCDEARAHPKAPGPGFEKVNPEWAKKYLKASAGKGPKDHCTFCDAKPRCVAFIAQRQAEAQMDFADEPEDMPLPKGLDAIAGILKWRPKFEELFRAASLYALRSLENGHDMPDYELVEGRSTRKLRDDRTPQEIADGISKQFKVSRATLFINKLKSGPQIEKLIRAKVPRETKALRLKFSRAWLVKPKGKATLALKGGKKIRVSRTVAEDFPDDDLDFG